MLPYFHIPKISYALTKKERQAKILMIKTLHRRAPRKPRKAKDQIDLTGLITFKILEDYELDWNVFIDLAMNDPDPPNFMDTLEEFKCNWQIPLDFYPQDNDVIHVEWFSIGDNELINDNPEALVEDTLGYEWEFTFQKFPLSSETSIVFSESPESKENQKALLNILYGFSRDTLTLWKAIEKSTKKEIWVDINIDENDFSDWESNDLAVYKIEIEKHGHDVIDIEIIPIRSDSIELLDERVSENTKNVESVEIFYGLEIDKKVFEQINKNDRHRLGQIFAIKDHYYGVQQNAWQYTRSFDDSRIDRLAMLEALVAEFKKLTIKPTLDSSKKLSFDSKSIKPETIAYLKQLEKDGIIQRET